MKRYSQTEIKQMRFIPIPGIAAIRQEIEARSTDTPQAPANDFQLSTRNFSGTPK